MGSNTARLQRLSIAMTLVVAGGLAACTPATLTGYATDTLGVLRLKNHATMSDTQRWGLPVSSAVTLVSPPAADPERYWAALRGVQRVLPNATFTAAMPEDAYGYVLLIDGVADTSPDPLLDSGVRVRLLPLDELPLPARRIHLRVRLIDTRSGAVIRNDTLVASPWLYASGYGLDNCLEHALARYFGRIVQRG